MFPSLYTEIDRSQNFNNILDKGANF